MKINDLAKGHTPKILLFDLETSPVEALVWGLWKQRISPESVIKDWSCLSWSAKWLSASEVMGESVTPEEAMNRTDKSIMKNLWNLIDESDIIMAHNGYKFDRRKMNARFILNGLKPPSPYQIIDTLKESRKLFAFSSHKLDYLGKLLVSRQKLETNYKLWKRCIGVFGEEEAKSALSEMLTYCKGDVSLLEEVYIEIRPWIQSHPNLGLYYDIVDEVCPVCGSDDLHWKGFYYTPAGRYRAFRCENCGAIGRSRYVDISPDQRRKLVRSVAR